MRLPLLSGAPNCVHPASPLLLHQLGRQLPVQAGAPLLLLGMLLMHGRQQVLVLALQVGHLQHRGVGCDKNRGTGPLGGDQSRCLVPALQNREVGQNW